MRERRDSNRDNYFSRSKQPKKPSPLAQSRYYARYDKKYDPRSDKSLSESIKNIEVGENLEIIRKKPLTQTELDSDILENSIAFNYLDPTGDALNQPGLEITDNDLQILSNALEYIWGTLVGDWNNNSDPMQDISNMVAGLIPVVDQALDVRDMTAHIYYMVFEKDYQDPWRWVALGLTAVGAIPTVGSVIKGLGKLAIFQDGAKAAAEYAEPLLKALKSINPEWADIGKLRAAINAGWDDGIGIGKELWLQTLADIKGKIDNTPVPKVFQNYKVQIQKTLGEIQQLSDMMLDEALNMIQYNVDRVLNELDRIIQPQLAADGVGNIKPRHMEIDGVGRNQPMRSSGNYGGSKIPSPPSGMSDKLINIRSTFKDPRAVEAFDDKFAKMRGNSKAMEKAMEGMRRSGSDIEARMLDEWKKDNPTPFGAGLSRVPDALARGQKLRKQVEAFEKANPGVKGISEWFERVDGELKKLNKMKKGTKEAASTNIDSALDNFKGVEAELRYAQKQPGVIGVNQKMTLDGIPNKVDVDVVADNGKTWIDNKSVPPFGLESSNWKGHGDKQGLKKQVEKQLRAAQQNLVDGVPPKVVIEFPEGVSRDVAEELQRMGAEARGTVVNKY